MKMKQGHSLYALQTVWPYWYCGCSSGYLQASILNLLFLKDGRRLRILFSIFFLSKFIFYLKAFKK